jgi:hypothetical protein
MALLHGVARQSVTWFFMYGDAGMRRLVALRRVRDGGCRSLASRTDTVTSPHDADVMLGYGWWFASMLMEECDRSLMSFPMVPPCLCARALLTPLVHGVCDFACMCSFIPIRSAISVLYPPFVRSFTST